MPHVVYVVYIQHENTSALCPKVKPPVIKIEKW